MPDTVKERIVKLRHDLNEHNYLYYVLNSPTLTDHEYDLLFQELIQLEKQHPELQDVNSPTSRIGHSSPSSFQKVKHRTKMLSLDNSYSSDDIIKFFEIGETVTVEPKIDGFSLELTYQGGMLVQAATRGDGSTGDDVTANVRTIQTVPLVLAEPLNVRIRGEVYMTYSVLNRLNLELAADGEDQFANVRNAASGTIKLKDPTAVAKRNLSFVAYSTPDEIRGVATQESLIEWLQTIGFQSITTLPAVESTEIPPLVITIQDKVQLEEMIETMDVYRKRLDLATDGLVLKINSIAKQHELGEGTRAPNWAVAYKYPPERKSTFLKDIKITIGKTGKLTPNAEFEPIALGGTVVTFASLCNADEIGRLNCNVGDEVWVEKSAEIIPKVMGVNKKHSRMQWKMPDKCPCCGTKVVREEGMVDYYCPNRDCDEQVAARLLHALGKACLDVDECGEVTVREMMAHGIRTLSDFFATPAYDESDEKPSFKFMKPAARKKMLEAREKAKHTTLWRKLHALGIDGIGKTTCQDMAAKWNALYAMFDDLDSVKKMIGEAKFASFTKFFADNEVELNRLDDLGISFENDLNSAGPLTGKFFVITGTLMSGKRDDVMRRIEEAGGTVKGSVTKSVHFLVAGDGGGKNKADAARKNGTIVITEEQLYQMMGKPMPVVGTDIDPDREF